MGEIGLILTGIAPAFFRIRAPWKLPPCPGRGGTPQCSSGWQMIAGPGNRFRGKSEHRQAACRGEHAGAPGQSPARRRVSQKTNRQRRRKTPVVRVKRRGKSPPPGAQAPGHEKPHAVQDRTGKPGRLTREASASPSRVLVAPCAGKACRSGDMREMIIESVSRRGGTKFGLSPPAFF